MRNLVITSPLTRGEDVKLLQHAINLRARETHYSPIGEDDQFGSSTLHAARVQGYLLGAPDLQLTGPVRPYLQLIIRAPARRSAQDERRGAVRVHEREHYIATHKAGPDSLLAWAKGQLGVTEHPPGSNRGPTVDTYEREFGILAAPWCGCFVGYGLRHHAGVHVGAGVTYVPTIAHYAHTGTGGFARAVPHSERRPGDIICFNFGAGLQHTGILDHDRAHTIEGNTSPGDEGSQDNGGCVAHRLRNPSTMAVIARPRWE